MRHFATPAVRLPHGKTANEIMPLFAGSVSERIASTPKTALRLERLDMSEQSIILVDLAGQAVWMNAEALRVTELCNGVLHLGHDWLDFWPVNERTVVSTALNSALAGIPARFSAASHTVAGNRTYWEVNITPDGPRIADGPTFTVYMQDVTERRLAHEQFKWAARHDGLTGLANRTLFHVTLSRMIENARDARERFAVVVFDLDRFKQINERLGHDGGDALLRGFATRLAGLVPADGLAARFGGDEFALLMKVEAGSCNMTVHVDAILERLRGSYPYKGQLIDCTASAGVATYPDAGDDAETLFSNADTALLMGKAKQPGRAMMFAGEMRQALQLKASALSVADAALQANGIEPHYQPKFDLATGRLCGLEALFRWRTPNSDWRSPAAISVALDDRFLAPKITDTMLRKVISDLGRWQKSGFAVPVAVNASEADLQDENFAERLLKHLATGGISPSLFELEVTEGVFLSNGAAHVASVLYKLSDAGVRIALDDFGTGYASLSHLKQFPVDVIKIDRSFVSNVASSFEDRTIVRTMIDLGKSMSIEVVAEGIEEEAQLAFLKEMGCDVGQGFWFAQALPAPQIEEQFLGRTDSDATTRAA